MFLQKIASFVPLGILIKLKALWYTIRSNKDVRKEFPIEEMRMFVETFSRMKASLFNKRNYLSFIVQNRNAWEQKLDRMDLKTNKAYSLKLSNNDEDVKSIMSSKEQWLFLKPNERTLNYIKTLTTRRTKKKHLKKEIVSRISSYVMGVAPIVTIMTVILWLVWYVTNTGIDWFEELSSNMILDFVYNNVLVVILLSLTVFLFPIILFLREYLITKNTKLNELLLYPAFYEKMSLIFLKRYDAIEEKKGNEKNAITYMNFPNSLYKEIEKLQMNEELLWQEDYLWLVNYLQDTWQNSLLLSKYDLEVLIEWYVKRINKEQSGRGNLLSVFKDIFWAWEESIGSTSFDQSLIKIMKSKSNIKDTASLLSFLVSIVMLSVSLGLVVSDVMNSMPSY